MALYSTKRLQDYYISNNLVDQKTIELAQVESFKLNVAIDDYLLERSIITKSDLVKARAYAMQVGYVFLSGNAVSPQALSFISEGIARQYTILPFEFVQKDDCIKVATADPLNLEVLSFLEKKTGKRIIPFLADKDDILDAINIQYQQSISPTVKSALQEYSTDNKQEEVVSNKKIVKEPPIAKIVNTILEFAIKSRSSDVHIEPQETKTRVRYRIDGILNERLVLPASLHDSLTSRIKILSQMRIDEKRVPQDGRFSFKIGDQEVDLRVSTLPTVHGEKIVMRLLKKTGGIPSLPDLGLDGVALKHLEYAITKPYGIVLVTGPTGSGKTTTLYSVLSRLNQLSVNIVTLEDPVEYEMPGINQVQVNAQAGLTFATGLRSFLRQDPNIILVGEIRDKETTQLAIQAALTGHLVFSTLHTNDAATAIPRLIDLGAEPFLITSVVNAVVGQRIVRRICPHCIKEYQPAPEIDTQIRSVLESFVPQEFVAKPFVLHKGEGCDECNKTGYLSRIGIYEIILTSPTLNQVILKEANAQAIENQAKKEGFITMKQDGFLKALKGITTIEEVMRVAEEM